MKKNIHLRNGEKESTMIEIWNLNFYSFLNFRKMKKGTTALDGLIENWKTPNMLRNENFAECRAMTRQRIPFWGENNEFVSIDVFSYSPIT
jgi:hypothetical protein